MNTPLRMLLAAGAATLGAAGLGLGIANAAQAIQVAPGTFCSVAEDNAGIYFMVDNAQGAEYRLVITNDGSEVLDTTSTIGSQSYEVTGPEAAYNVMVEGWLTIDGQEYHYGPVAQYEVDGKCYETFGVHDIHASVEFLCIEGDPTINLTVENSGDYLEPLSGMFVGESFDTEVGAGQSTNAQKVVAVGAPYEFSVLSGQTTLLEDEGTMPDVCETGGDAASGGGLPETGSEQTTLTVMAGLLLALGAAMVRITTRRNETEELTDLV